MRQTYPKEKKKRPKRTLSPLPRKIHFSNGDVWSYRIHPGADVTFIPPDGSRRIHVRAEDITGMTPDQIERGLWKRWFSLKPSHLKQYIEENLR